jgi:hypothetical protein
MGAGTVTQTWDSPVLTFSWTADVSGGSVPATASELSFEAFVCLVVTDPGTTAPTDNYDITITDADGVDIMGGQLLNRDTANSEHAVPKIGSAYGCRPFQGTMTVNIINNSVNSATGEVKVWILR